MANARPFYSPHFPWPGGSFRLSKWSPFGSVDQEVRGLRGRISDAPGEDFGGSGGRILEGFRAPGGGI